MSQFNLPVVPDYRNYSFEVELDGETFTLEFYYNARDEAYYMSVYDAFGVAVVQGRKLTDRSFPLYGVRTENRPAGTIYLSDPAHINRPPVVGELGDDFELIYLDEAELDLI